MSAPGEGPPGDVGGRGGGGSSSGAAPPDLGSGTSPPFRLYNKARMMMTEAPHLDALGTTRGQ